MFCSEFLALVILFFLNYNFLIFEFDFLTLFMIFEFFILSISFLIDFILMSFPNSVISLACLSIKDFLSILLAMIISQPFWFNFDLAFLIRSSVSAAKPITSSGRFFDLYKGNLIIIDFGTATTFDVVGKDGAYLGGAIAPGVSVSIKALHDAAAALPYVDVRRPDNVIGKNTKDCIQSGVFWGYIGLIEGIINKIRSEFSDKMTTVATGGLAPLFGRETKIFDFIDLDITMHGMNVIYNFNQSKK